MSVAVCLHEFLQTYVQNYSTDRLVVMKTKKSQIFLGTSGWMNKDWHDHFYPKGLKEGFLQYLSRVFNSVEINSSFYRLPLPTTFEKWRGETPKDFVFSVKLSRYITHIERLNRVKRQTETFIRNASMLKNKLGVILVQLPPSLPFKKNQIKTFLKNFNELRQKYSPKVRIAVEPRHPSWFEGNIEEIRKLFKQFDACMVFAHSSKFVSFEPLDENITSSFVYLRLHGPQEFAASEYGGAGLKKWIGLIRGWSERGLAVFVYFNNDVHGYAVKDALKSLKLLAT
jgi:uncharacterized protein YecE (DUF72 family)